MFCDEKSDVSWRVDIRERLKMQVGGKGKAYYANCSTLVFEARNPIQVVMKLI